MSHQITFFHQVLSTYNTLPVFGPIQIMFTDGLLFNERRHSGLLHIDWKRHKCLSVHSSCVPLQGTSSWKLIGTEEAGVWVGLNMVAFDVAMSLALIGETFVAKTTAPKSPSTSIRLTNHMLFNVTQHFVLLQIDWKRKFHYQIGFIYGWHLCVFEGHVLFWIQHWCDRAGKYRDWSPHGSFRHVS